MEETLPSDLSTLGGRGRESEGSPRQPARGPLRTSLGAAEDEAVDGGVEPHDLPFACRLRARHSAYTATPTPAAAASAATHQPSLIPTVTAKKIAAGSTTSESATHGTLFGQRTAPAGRSRSTRYAGGAAGRRKPERGTRLLRPGCRGASDYGRTPFPIPGPANPREATRAPGPPHRTKVWTVPSLGARAADARHSAPTWPSNS